MQPVGGATVTKTWWWETCMERSSIDHHRLNSLSSVLLICAPLPMATHRPPSSIRWVQAVALHFRLAHDHPFLDGNGRTARALK
ncbi:MAG: Fic family protein [Synechococcus sp. SB0665_bin_28]|nr:Fic family protein [Synechococcus sp. SB0665_bin_28]MYF36628.1 Fic family protein [Synechococcus sp. SB0678_bin_12]